MLLSTFNSTHAYPVSGDEMNRIIARQQTAYSKADQKPSALQWVLPHDPEALQTLYDEVRMDPQLREYLKKYSEKIVNKWWGPQGRALVKPFDELIAPYKEQRVVDIDDLLQDDEIVREYAAEVIQMIDFLKQMLKEKGTLIASPREAYSVQLKQPKSSSGYRGFTTSESRSPALMASASKSAAYMANDQRWSKDPFIVWYRDMRQKYRLIFATSLSHMIIYRRFLANILTVGVGKVDSIFYHSSKVESYQVQGFFHENSRRHTSQPVDQATAVICADYEQMDTGCSLELCTKILGLTLDLVEVSPTEKAEILAALSIFFTSPLIDFEGQVHFGPWNLLSGMGPTNGMECLINKFLQVATRVLVKRRLLEGKPVSLRSSLRVMGDDSALLLALRAKRKHNIDVQELLTSFVSEFIDEFERVSKRAGLRVQKEKQEYVIGDGFYTYCREVYPANSISSRMGFCGYPGGVKDLPVPIYPLEYAINNTINPESYPRFDFTSGLLPTASAAEVAAMCSRLDKCFGDPRYTRYMATVCESLRKYRKERALPKSLTYSFVWDAMFSTAPIAEWRTKLYGAERWQPEYSPTLQKFYDLGGFASFPETIEPSICDWVGQHMHPECRQKKTTLEEALQWIDAHSQARGQISALLLARQMSGSSQAPNSAFD